jgi:nucleoid-associated protein YgaU
MAYLLRAGSAVIGRRDVSTVGASPIVGEALIPVKPTGLRSNDQYHRGVTDRGLPIADASLACPFVAFGDDRDARSDQPDHRHRCYAEIRPAPRATAHQERYCLTAAFGSCPTFQDWARREAAQVRWPSGRTTPGPAAPVAAIAASAQQSDDARVATSTEATEAASAEAASTDPEATRESASAAVPAAAAGLAASRFLRPEDLAEDVPPSRDPRAWAVPPPWSGPPADAAVEPDAPAFLGDRDAAGSGPAAGSGRTELLPAVAEWDEPPVPPPRRRRRERVDPSAPSWEEPRRFEAYPTIKTRLAMPSLSRPLLGLVLLVLAAAALFLLPSFLLDSGGGGGAVASPSPSATASRAVSPSPEPSPTPLIYVVKKGDTMTKIARAHGVTLEALIAANKDTVPDPDKVKVGQELVIPTTPEEESAEPASEAPSPSR